jgi:hypothetical protein
VRSGKARDNGIRNICRLSSVDFVARLSHITYTESKIEYQDYKL